MYITFLNKLKIYISQFKIKRFCNNKFLNIRVTSFRFYPTTADSIERSDALLPRFRNCNNNRSHPVHNFTNNGTHERSRLSFRVSFVDWFAKMSEIPWDSWVEIPIHNGMNFTPIWRWINSKVGKSFYLVFEDAAVTC